MIEAKSYKCKYCGEVFEKPLLLTRHVRSKHKKAKKREKNAAAKVMGAEQIKKTIEAIGILKALQVSPHLSDEERKILGGVAKIIEGLLADIQKSK
jgi:uncharacterized C2H2 Zn-finger protein